MDTRTVQSIAALLVAAAVGLAASPGAAQAPDTPDERAKHRIDAIAAETDPAVAIARFDDLRQLEDYLARDAYHEQLKTLAERVGSPLVEYRVRRAEARVRLNLHDSSNGWDGMDGPLGRQGCLLNWQIVGPFDNDSMGGFRRRLGPEQGEAGPYDGKMTKVRWRGLPEVDRFCVLRLGRTIQPSTSAVTYLAGSVKVDEARSARLLTGASGAYKVWVNGELVAHQERDTGLAPDSRAWPVQLKADGPNRVLVKLGSQSDGGLAWTARLVDANLEPLAAKMTPEWSGEAVQSTETPEDGDAAKADAKTDADGNAESQDSEGAGDSEAGPRPTGQGVLGRAKKCAQNSEGREAVWCAYLWERTASQLAATPWRDIANGLLQPLREAEDPAAVDTPLTGEDVVRLSDLFDEKAKRLAIVELAAEMDGGDPWVQLELARLYGSSIAEVERVRERRLLEELQQANPGFWPATLRLADWYARHDFSAKGLALVEELELKEAEKRPAYLRAQVNHQQQAGTRERAAHFDHALYLVSGLYSDWAAERITELAVAGKRQRARDLVDKQRRLHPGSRYWALREARLLRADGKMKAALGIVDTLLDQRPGSVGLRRKRAEYLLAMERPEEARATLERALELRPQNKGLRDFLSFLEPEASRFHEPWMIEDVREVADKHEASSYSQDTVIDQTVVRVAPNGLYQKVVQRVERVNTSEGIDSADGLSISHQAGDEQVDVLGVRVHKPDGTVLEGYDQWMTESSGGGSYYTDQRYVNLRANNVEVGDLVEFRYRVRQVANENFRGDYFGDVSFVQDTQPIGLARYVVEYPETWSLYFREPALEHAKITSRPGKEAEAPTGFAVEGFELSDVPAVQTDSRQPGYTDVYDYILVSNKKTWDEVGTWWWNLIEEQLIASEAIKEKVAEVTEGLKTDRAKMEAIHNWVVKNTRYLHVGLGVHGWKPYKTTSCFNNKYGDCKDKASLMKVMLEEAGIDTKLVLVRTRRLGHVDKFPPSMHIFNHAINYVPSMDLFLDPTAEFNGTTELTPMDQGAQALIVDDGGDAKFVTLPVDDPGDNLVTQKLSVEWKDGTTHVRGKMTARGQNAVYYRQSLEDPERRDEEFEKQLANTYPGADLVSASYKNLNALEKPVIIEFHFTGGRIERSTGGESFVFPYGAPKDLLGRYAQSSSRNQDLKIRVPYANETTVEYRLPEGRRFERVPDSVAIDTEFGELKIDYKAAKDNRVLTVDIRYSLAVQRVAVQNYEAFRSFLSDATSALGTALPLSSHK